MRFEKITLVGVGLLGGSLGLAIRERNLAAEVWGYVRRPEAIGECQKQGAVHRATVDLAQAARDADLVIFCTPIAQMAALAALAAPVLKPGALVTDVGSVKGNVVATLEDRIAAAGGRFVGSHPMAGAERTGVAAARSDLFIGAVCVVTPTDRSEKEAVIQIEQFWQSLGARTLRLTPAVHDELVGRSSHLPHVLAAELADYVLDPVHPRQQEALCANGFRDTTRIASGSPEMWRDIALANRQNLAQVLESFIDALRGFHDALQRADAAAIEQLFTRAKKRRDQWNRQNQSSTPE